MKRRQAIRQIAIVSSGIALLPACRPESSEIIYTRLSLDRAGQKLLEQFTTALLPAAKTPVSTPETAVQFILTVLNDCHSPEDIQKYKTGLKELENWLDQNYHTRFEKLTPEKQAEAFARLSGKENLPESLPFFYKTTRSLTLEHFTSSEYFLSNVLKWQFAPGRFSGCVAV
jgi:hypothetical protein